MGAHNESRRNPAVYATRQHRAFELTLRGLSLREVARQMTDEGMTVSHETVRQLVATEAKERVAPLKDELRTQQRETLRQALITVYDVLAETADPDIRLKAVDRVVRVSERLARLDGLDAPEQFTGQIGVFRVDGIDVQALR